MYLKWKFLCDDCMYVSKPIAFYSYHKLAIHNESKQPWGWKDHVAVRSWPMRWKEHIELTICARNELENSPRYVDDDAIIIIVYVWKWFMFLAKRNEKSQYVFYVYEWGVLWAYLLIDCPKRISKNLTKYLTYGFRFPSSGYKPLRPSW